MSCLLFAVIIIIIIDLLRALLIVERNAHHPILDVMYRVMNFRHCESKHRLDRSLRDQSLACI